MYVIKEANDYGLKIGVTLFDFHNPIATKGDYLICNSDFFLNDRQVYELYKKESYIGFFTSLNEAKNKVESIELENLKL